MKIRKYHYEVETLEAGQRQAYSDGYYHYIVTNKNPINKGCVYESHDDTEAKMFCTKFLDPAVSHEDQKELAKKDFGGNFAHYYTSFKKLERGRYEYKVVHPSTH